MAALELPAYHLSTDANANEVPKGEAHPGATGGASPALDLDLAA